MPPTIPKTQEKRLGALPRDLISIIIPVALTAIPPLAPAALLIFIIALALWFCVRQRQTQIAQGLSHCLAGMIIGLALSLLWRLPALWNLVAALAVLLAGLGVQGQWEERHGLKAPRAPQRRKTSAWGKGCPEKTPEGDPIRILGMGEIAMGGPITCDYLFPDGVLLCNLGSAARFSSDGRYFAAPMPSRQAWGLAILDRQQRRLYYSPHSAFWELDEFTADTLYGRHSPLTTNTSSSMPLGELLANARAVNLVPVRDLWLTPDWQKCLTPTSRDLPTPPAGAHQVTALRFLPESLRDRDHPLALLSRPAYTLTVDEQPSGLLIDDNEPIIWRADGQAFCCRANAGPARAPGMGAYWLWEAGKGWDSLPQPWTRTSDEPSLYCGRPAALGNSAIYITGELERHRPSQGRFGYRLDYDGGGPVITGHSPEGRMITETRPDTRIQLVLPLGSRGGRGAATVKSMPLENGRRMRFEWHHDQGNRGVYHCRMGDWQLPGQWLLEHRVSDCGRYIALVPAPPASHPPGSVTVVDSRHRTLVPSAPLLVASLQDFHNGVLSLVEILGKQDKNVAGTALHPFQQMAPPPARATAFLQEQAESELYYQSQRFEVQPDGLTLLPHWRQIDQPQLAIADGDFVYPSPTGQDAAWLFGAVAQTGGAFLDESNPRHDGYLLTASGYAFGGLTPAMIWSADGRYLALTHGADERDESGHKPWYLLILEPATGCLYQSADSIGCLPYFQSFDDKGLQVLVHQYDWEVDDDPGQLRRFSMQELFDLPHITLEHSNGWAFAPDQEDNAALWRALDRSPLQPWVQS